MMERWRGVVKVPLKNPGGIPALYRVAVSLYLSTPSQTLAVPSANAILFVGDRVSVTRSTVIQRLSDSQKLADLLVSKFGDSINAWVIEAAVYNGPFAVYHDCIPTVHQWGEPKSYNPTGFPASNSTASLLSNCLHEIKLRLPASSSSNGGVPDPLPTYILGFSKGGTVVNQLVTELSCLEPRSGGREQRRVRIIPESGEDLLSSITEVHYVDVGLNSAGAYVTDHGVIERIGKRLNAQGEGGAGIRFVLHGTPRQWCDDRRAWIREEKDELIRLLEMEAGRSAAAGTLQVREKLYFADRVPDMEMHFEVLDAMDVSRE
ncbi:unnamed protein product [Linum tenue]|uniref:Uncharacterized protein n=1 Tax=Linum tenue TaxID=586396 RepID=A0AAV0NB23_9ROSI|nr:unnamed protein product [Linum tenue]